MLVQRTVFSIKLVREHFSRNGDIIETNESEMKVYIRLQDNSGVHKSSLISINDLWDCTRRDVTTSSNIQGGHNKSLLI